MNKSKNVFIGEHISTKIYVLAEEFFKASKSLAEVDDNSSPSIVCAAFSIELFLKALNAETLYKDKYEYPDGSVAYDDLYDCSLVKGGHNLKVLFDNIPAHLKDEIRKQYQGKYKSWPSIDAELDNIKDVFVHFRYTYERKTYVLHKTALLNLSGFLYNYLEGKLKGLPTPA